MTSVTTTCRDVSELTTNAQLACKLLFQECFKAGITDIFITETYRSQERQNYLYAQGRTRPGNVVTWTLNSNHKSRRAWDIAVSPPKSLYDVTTLNSVGAIAKKLGITWGGTWTGNIDRPHFEIPTNWTMPKGFKIEGTVVIPTSSKVKVQLIKDKVKEEVVVTKDSTKYNPGTVYLEDGSAEFLEKAMDAGIINSDVHLKDLKDGNMTSDRFVGLVATALARLDVFKK